MSFSFLWPGNWFKKKKKPARAIEVVEIPEEVENEGERDNEDIDKPDDLGIEEEKYPSNERKLIYPKAIYYGEEMRTRGRYKNDYPQGAIIHFTAGRSRKKSEGGTRAKDTHKEMGKKSIDSAIKKNAYCYAINDRNGNIHQAFKLNRWGAHAGKSSWPGIRGGVSDELLGIENQCAGRVKKERAGLYKAYFTTPSKGDKYFLENEVRHYDADIENIQKGIYHILSKEQEKGLVEYLLWLKRNNPGIFDFDKVLSHDEVAPDRKNDVGGSLSMTMNKFRAHLKKEYKARYEV